MDGAVNMPVFPVRVSADGRYFVDQNGQPVFWLGDTQWDLFRQFTLEEARTILQKRTEQGFTSFQIMMIGIGDGTQANMFGEPAWIEGDPKAPNEAYFQDADRIIDLAGQFGMVLVIGVYHQWQRDRCTPEAARGWARWLAERYRDAPHVVWSMYPEAKREYVPVLQALAAGLREGDDGRHLITVHPDPSPTSSSFIQEEAWIDFHSIQTWADVERIVPMVAHDYDLTPVKPVLMAEGAYEAGTEYRFDVTSLWVRRQAYYSYLAGGHHAYGHNDIWRVLPTWPQALDAEGAQQLGVLKQVFVGRPEWWNLVPDPSLLVAGGEGDDRIRNLAARHRDGRWALVYLAAPATVTVDLGKITGGDRARAVWIDPRNGETLSAGEHATKGAQSFMTPDGWEDALLVVEAV